MGGKRGLPCEAWPLTNAVQQLQDGESAVLAKAVAPLNGRRRRGKLRKRKHLTRRRK